VLSNDAYGLKTRIQSLIQRQPPGSQLDFSDKLGALREIESNLWAAANNIESAKSGPRTGDVYILVDSKKRDTSREYIAAVCQIADPGIGSGTIDDAMKRAIKSGGGIARNSKR
jgi:hypothetical protein